MTCGVLDLILTSHGVKNAFSVEIVHLMTFADPEASKRQLDFKFIEIIFEYQNCTALKLPEITWFLLAG